MPNHTSSIQPAPAPAIRPATPADAAVVTEFNLRLAHETEGRELDPQRLRAGVEAVLTDPAKGQYWLAEVGGMVVGQLMITLEWSDWRNGFFWWIQSVYVRRDWRGRGVFKALYEAVRTRALRQTDVCGLRLYMEQHNAQAQAAYERLGWQRTGYHLYEVEFGRSPG